MPPRSWSSSSRNKPSPDPLGISRPVAGQPTLARCSNPGRADARALGPGSNPLPRPFSFLTATSRLSSSTVPGQPYMVKVNSRCPGSSCVWPWMRRSSSQVGNRTGEGAAGTAPGSAATSGDSPPTAAATTVAASRGQRPSQTPVDRGFLVMPAPKYAWMAKRPLAGLEAGGAGFLFRQKTGACHPVVAWVGRHRSENRMTRGQSRTITPLSTAPWPTGVTERSWLTPFIGS